ncbi:MAG TPA: GAF domain-containing protein, partial [Vicinamibacteria bacterium]|nr:GAF domain-containing protein [Vicinamibacteria bacterium]
MNPDDPNRKSQEFFSMFLKAKEFTEELLKENERLRFKIASLETGAPPAADDRVKDLNKRVRELEERLAEMEARYRKVEEENKEFADRYIEIEEQNNNLANLYVASYQLHSTLDYKEVVRIVQEIVINLIGAEAFHIFMVSEKTGRLELEASEGQTAPVTSLALGDGVIGNAAKTGENHFAESVAYREPTPFDRPIAVIPLKIKESVIGVISINKLLVQ